MAGPTNDDSQPAGITAEVTLPRVANALAELGYSPLEREDRLVVGLPGYIVTCWIKPQLPATLHMDGQLRVPLPLDSSPELTRVLNTYNGQAPGPTASYRVSDAGTLRVRLRAGACVSDGMSENQLRNWLRTLLDASEHVVHELDRIFPEADLFAPLPEPLCTEQDYVALTGAHPRWRHRSESHHGLAHTEVESFDYSQTQLRDKPEARPQWLNDQMLRDAVGALGFTYGIRADNVLLTTINGMSVSVEALGGQWVRVLGMWYTDLPSAAHMTNLALLCNEANERSLLERCSVFGDTEHAIVAVSAHLLVDAGVSPAQLFTHVQHAIRFQMDALEYISLQATGTSCIDWPSQSPDAQDE